MKRVIKGKVYNTETAEEVCDIPCNYDSGDFKFHYTKLYKTKKGAFFLAGKGGPMSIWGEQDGKGLRGGQGIRVLSEEEARDYMEYADCTEEEFQRVGLGIEEG